MKVRDVPDEYVQCRGWSHLEWVFTTLEREGGEYVQGLRCLACGTEKKVRRNARTGRRKPGNKYIYPEDLNPEAVPYKMPKGSGGVFTAEERDAVAMIDIKSRLDEVAARKR